jgi:curved DNA-binding protein CbpA
VQKEAFETLGIPPTIDGRAIRAAFVRFARIYHPDRFIGQPDDVREEAERRMKDAAAAYELLRASNKTHTPPKPTINDKELRERARKYQEAMEARQRQDERNRARWLRWEAIEQQARERVEAEAAVAAIIREGNHAQASPGRVRPDADPVKKASKAPKPASAFAERLDAARRNTTALAPHAQN